MTQPGLAFVFGGKLGIFYFGQVCAGYHCGRIWAQAYGRLAQHDSFHRCHTVIGYQTMHVVGQGTFHGICLHAFLTIALESDFYGPISMAL